MCKWGTYKRVYVKVPADLSSTGSDKWKFAKIDACIADLVKALQESRIDMRGSCCGHGKMYGDIHLQDGRVLLILQEKDAEDYFVHRLSLFFRMLIRQLLWEYISYPIRLCDNVVRGWISKFDSK